MAISVFDLFSIGIGPSSSHTVGPMRAAFQFAHLLEEVPAAIKVDLYGSLALTGKGHGTDIAVLLGLQGEAPEDVDPNSVDDMIADIRNSGKILFLGKYPLPFHEESQLLFHQDKQLPYHPNGMRFTAYGPEKKEIISKVFYSVGGGFIVDHETAKKDKNLGDETHHIPYPFYSGDELLSICENKGMTIAQLVMENEKSWRPEQEVRRGLLKIWKVMQDCITRGCAKDGILPGGLKVKRRAPDLMRKLAHLPLHDPSATMQWLSLWALAVNEENAAGGRVVTAPTNGASGVIPSVISYYVKFTKNPTEEGIIDFFLTAGAIGILIKENASISAAEMGCMGEVGVACSMAAAGLTAALGGSLHQVENAAEIGMEHNLGLTCDPVRGLVQIPCIERNTMGAVKAVNACLLALQEEGRNRVTFDQVVATMRQTGLDMGSIYKETSQGGLAVNVPEC